MHSQIARKLKPEEEELLRKRDELAASKTLLAERELGLADLRGELAEFEALYLRTVGFLYAELDDWNARIAELKAKRDPSSDAEQRAHSAREQARHTFETAYGDASRAPHFDPSPDLKRLFREVAKRIHPDLANDSPDQERRTQLMAEANRAYQAGDTETLQSMLDEHYAFAEDLGEGIGAELVRIIRQISQAKRRISEIEEEMIKLRASEIYLLRSDGKRLETLGRDLLTELAISIREQLRVAKKSYDDTSQAGASTANVRR